MKQQDVSFFWDGDDLVIAIHNARPNASAFVSALLAAGGIQKSDGTAEPVSVKPYPAPKMPDTPVTESEEETSEEKASEIDLETVENAGIVRKVRAILETKDPSDYLVCADPDEAFRDLSIYWASKMPFRHKDVSAAMTDYIIARFDDVKDPDEYAARLSDDDVTKLLRYFAYAYKAEERHVLQKVDMAQKRKFIASLIYRCQKLKKERHV